MLAVAAAIVFLSGCKGEKGPSVPPPSFDASFDMNAIQDIKEGVNGQVKITALGKVRELTVTLNYPDDTYQKLVASLIGIASNQPVKGQKSAIFDLVNDAKAVTSMGASRAQGLTSCSLDLMKVVNVLTSTGATNNDQFKFAIKVVDVEGQTSTKTITYKWTAEPTFTWVEMKASGVEYKDASKATANFKITAPAGLTKLTVKVTTDMVSFNQWLNQNIKIEANRSNEAPLMDLLEDAFVQSYFGVKASDMKDKKTEVKLDLSKILKDFVERGAPTGSVIKMDFTVGDSFARDVKSETVIYKYTGDPVE